MSKRVGTLLLITILALSLSQWVGPSAGKAAPQADSTDEVVLDNVFRVAFYEFVNHDDDTSTWYYTVEELPSAKDLSNWVLEIPFCTTILDAGPEPWEIVDPDPNLELSGVKWETGDGFQQGQFWVELDSQGQPGPTSVAAKGPDVAFGEITGFTCVEAQPPEPPPPLGQDDVEPPTVEWIEPVQQGETYTLQGNQSVNLVVTALDDVAVDRVEFLRWDAIAKFYKTIAVDSKAPYLASVSASELNPTWNQTIAASFDTSGNFSGWKNIWLYKPVDGSLIAPGGAKLFVPLIRR
jgi:hypothetical protein